MLAIRLQRTGRSGHAQFRVIVQDSRFSPKRGRIVAYLGSYDPHTKALTIDGPKASQYLEKGAQPSERVARLLQKEGIKLPAWVRLGEPQKGAVRHPEKRRSTRPAEPAAPAPADESQAPAEATVEEATAEETPPPAETETPAEAPAEETAASAVESPPESEAPSEEAQ